MSMVELVFLGTTAGIPTRKRAHPAIHLRYTARRERCYLLDCGEGTQRQLLFAGINPLKIEAIFISHWHADHYLGLPGLVDTMGFESRTEPLHIYSPEPERVRALLAIGYAQPSFPVSVSTSGGSCPELTPLLDGGEFLLQSFPVAHTVPAVGYVFLERDRVGIDRDKLAALNLPLASPVYRHARVDGTFAIEGREIRWEQILSKRKGKRIVYSGDTAVCESLEVVAHEADLLVQDCTYFEVIEDSYGHACLNEVLAMARRASVKQVVLTHISRRYGSHENLCTLVSGHPHVSVAQDFMKVVV